MFTRAGWGHALHFSDAREAAQYLPGSLQKEMSAFVQYFLRNTTDRYRVTWGSGTQIESQGHYSGGEAHPMVIHLPTHFDTRERHRMSLRTVIDPDRL